MAKMQTQRDLELLEVAQPEIWHAEIRDKSAVFPDELETASHLDGVYLLEFLHHATSMDLVLDRWWRRCKLCRKRLFRVRSDVRVGKNAGGTCWGVSQIIGLDFKRNDYSSYTTFICSSCGEVHVRTKVLPDHWSY